MQEHDWEKIEADGGAMEGGQTQRNGGAMRRTLLRPVSPVTHVTKTSSPMLIVHAVDDAVVPIAQSRRLHEVLQKTGVASELLELPDGGHSFRRLTTPETLEKITKFFEKHLK